MVKKGRADRYWAQDLLIAWFWGKVIIRQPQALTPEIARFDHATGQVLADRIMGQSRSSCNLANRHLLAEMPSPENT